MRKMASGGMRLDTNAITTASKPGHASQTAASGGKRTPVGIFIFFLVQSLLTQNMTVF